MNLDLKNQVPLDPTFSYLKVTDGVYRILVDRQYCNTELIIGSEKAAVIDTGFGFGDLPAAVRKLTEKPLLLFNTHCHVDHVGGNAPFGLPVHMGREDIEAARKSNYAAFRVHSWDDRIARLGPESVAGMDREEYLNRGAGELVPCEEGERFDLGGLHLSVFAISGHSLGGRAYYLEEKKILYTGDAVFACTLCFGRGSAGRKKFIEGLKKLDALPFEQILSGHYIEPFDHEFIRKAVHTAETAVFETGIPLPNPIDPNARVCFPPDAPPSQETIERIRQGDHGLDNKVWALVLSSPE